MLVAIYLYSLLILASTNSFVIGLSSGLVVTVDPLISISMVISKAFTR